MNHQTEKNKKKLLKLLRKHLGVVTAACREMGMAPKTYHEWYKEDPIFAAEVDEISELPLDITESKMFEEIQKGNVRLIQFYLRYKGSRRGYIDSSKLDVTTNGEPITNVKIEEVKKKE